MQVAVKLKILADSAKYDASCASSGVVAPQHTRRPGQLGRHRHLPQLHPGRPLRLAAQDPAHQLLHLRLPVLRQSRLERRARARASRSQEVVDLTLDFYRRNYIEGLFLSSGIIQSADYTTEQLVEVARRLRLDHQLRRLHPPQNHSRSAPQLLVAAAGSYADRVSANIELPTQADLDRLAPDKTPRVNRRFDGRSCGRTSTQPTRTARRMKHPRALRAGRADDADDCRRQPPAATPCILQTASRTLRPSPSAPRLLLGVQPVPPAPRTAAAGVAAAAAGTSALSGGLADALTTDSRVDELTTDRAPNLPLDMSPKLAWAAAASGDLSGRR